MSPVFAVVLLKLAVLNLQATSVDPGLATTLSEALVGEVAAQSCCQVISTSDIQAMLGFERERQMLTCAEESSCLAEIGGSLGVEKILVGTLGKVDDTYVLALKLIDIRKGTVEARSQDYVEGKAALLLAAIRRRVPELVVRLGAGAPKTPEEGAATGRAKPELAAAALTADATTARPSWNALRLGALAGVLAAGAGAGVGGWMRHQSNLALKRYDLAVVPVEIAAERRQAQSRQTAANVSFVLCGLAFAAGATMFALDF